MKNSPKAIPISSLVRFLSYATGILGFISVFRYIDITYSALFAVLFALSYYFDTRQLIPFPRWLINIISFAFVGITFLRFTMDDPVTPVVETLLILLAMKFLEKKSIRDYMQIYLISVLLLTGSALLSLNIEFAVYLLIMMFLLSVSIISLTYYSQEKDLILTAHTVRGLILKAMIIPLMAIPLTAFLFVFLPRTNIPLLNFLNRSGGAVTGFSDNVSLGGISDIQTDEAIIMRVRMERIDDSKLYWRGIVFDYFDGKNWRNSGSEIPAIEKKLSITGERINYTVYLEPYDNKYIFFLDKPFYPHVKETAGAGDLTFKLRDYLIRRIRYEGISIISDVFSESVTKKEIYLQLPEKKYEKISEIVREITQNKDEQASAHEILKFLKDGDYKYSLSNLPITEKPLEDFLFVHKYGNCEYFASAMTVMLRIRGIPARIVGGYKGGYYNDMGRYYAIPQKYAHVWVEAHIPDKGWIRLDPTPAADADFSSLPGRFLQLRIFLDTINYHWNAFIINYDFTKQISLLNKIRLNIQRPRLDIASAKESLLRILPFIALAAAIIAFSYFFIFKRRPYEDRIISLFLKKMGGLGYEKNKTEGLEEFAQRVHSTEIRDKASFFVQEFEKYFYRDKKLTREDFLRLKAILKGLKDRGS